MNNSSEENLSRLQKGIRKIYSNQGFRTKSYVFLRTKLCPIFQLIQYVPKRGMILDLGCGIGLFANILYLDSSQRKVLGIDRAFKRVETARKASEKNPQIEIQIRRRKQYFHW